MMELRAHLRGEIQLSETVYHVPPETDVRALRETLGLSQRTSPPCSDSTCARCRTGSRAGDARRSPSVPTWPSFNGTRGPSSAPCAPREPEAQSALDSFSLTCGKMLLWRMLQCHRRGKSRFRKPSGMR